MQRESIAAEDVGGSHSDPGTAFLGLDSRYCQVPIAGGLQAPHTEQMRF